MTTGQMISHLFELKDLLGEDHTIKVISMMLENDPWFHFESSKQKEMLTETYKWAAQGLVKIIELDYLTKEK